MIFTSYQSFTLLLTVIEVSSSHLFTARVSEGSKVVLFSQNTVGRPTWLPSVQEAHQADTVRLREIHINGTPMIAPVSQKNTIKGKKRDWLTLLVRETLGEILSLLYGAIANAT